MIAEDLRTHVAAELRRCQMPPDEIRWVLNADEPAVVHMILELHGERLQEELAERQRAIGELEARLIERRHDLRRRRSPPVQAISTRTRWSATPAPPP